MNFHLNCKIILTTINSLLTYCIDHLTFLFYLVFWGIYKRAFTSRFCFKISWYKIFKERFKGFRVQ